MPEPKTDVIRSKNRVGDFFLGVGESVGRNRLQSENPCRRKRSCGYETASGAFYYAMNDYMGNVIGLCDASDGSIDAEYEYDPFGREIRATGTYADENPFRFSSQYTDTETDLVYFGFRYYMPEWGRFLNRDPLEELGGINLYRFVSNDPVNRWDLLGLAESETYNPSGGVFPSGMNGYSTAGVGAGHDYAGAGGGSMLSSSKPAGTLSSGGNSNTSLGSSNDEPVAPRVTETTETTKVDNHLIIGFEMRITYIKEAPTSAPSGKWWGKLYNWISDTNTLYNAVTADPLPTIVNMGVRIEKGVFSANEEASGTKVLSDTIQSRFVRGLPTTTLPDPDTITGELTIYKANDIKHMIEYYSFDQTEMKYLEAVGVPANLVNVIEIHRRATEIIYENK